MTTSLLNKISLLKSFSNKWDLNYAALGGGTSNSPWKATYVPASSHLWYCDAIEKKLSVTWWSCRYSSENEFIPPEAFSSVLFPKGLAVSSSLLSAGFEWVCVVLSCVAIFCIHEYTKGALTVSQKRASIINTAEVNWAILYFFRFFSKKCVAK